VEIQIKKERRGRIRSGSYFPETPLEWRGRKKWREGVNGKFIPTH